MSDVTMMNRWTLSRLVLIGCLACVCGIGLAQNELSPELRIDSLFSKYSSKSPGVAIAVLKDNEITYSRGYGMANLEYDIPITPGTVFHIASVSKQFTAFAIYLLKDQGVISLEDDVRTYIPELPDYGYVIKIKHLLAHTSGLRDQWALLTLAGWHLEDVISTEQILKLAINQKSLNFRPGTEFSYCNTSYTLLTEIVERTTGKSFPEFTKEYIFNPLGMKDTQFYDDFHKIVKNRAYSYELKKDTYVKKKLNYSNVGPTSMFSTAEDLAKWSANFFDPIVGSKSLLDEFNQVSVLDNQKPVVFRIIGNDTLYHAKGQLIRNHRGITMYKHGGHDAGFRAFLARFPKEKLSIITLSNDEHYEIFARGLELAEFYLEDNMNRKDAPIRNATKDVDSQKTFSSDLKKFLGEYFSDELSTSYRIQLRVNKLVVLHKRLSDMELTRAGDKVFRGNNYFDFEIKFTEDENGLITGFVISNFGVRNLVFKKLK